ncbi:MAG: hemolysin III family protein [Candidatus Sumerlaeaceae bacterium]|nr:hemolysin III family protein [Candidatus Sumerlaeaceae bacterium]
MPRHPIIRRTLHTERSRVEALAETWVEELANAVTHGIGAVLSIAGLVVMVTFAAFSGDPWRIVSCAIYGTSLCMLYTASTLYHTFQHPTLKSFLRICDHSCIYLLIAGSYTPFALVTLRGPLGWTVFGVIWGLAFAGIIFKLFLTGKHEMLSTLLYLGMGWISVIMAKPLLAHMPMAGVGLIIAGGVAYTFGVIFYAWERLPYNHAIWHLFVLAGSLFHFLAVLLYVLPVR